MSTPPPPPGSPSCAARRRGPRLDANRASAWQRWLGAAVLLAALAAALVLRTHDPSDHPDLPRCPTIEFAGVLCPGCGSTRATHHLLNGRVAASLQYNPALLLLGAPVAAWAIAQSIAAAVFGRRLRWPISGRAGYALVIALLAYMVVRNLPGAIFDGLRPPPPPPAPAVTE